MGVIRPQCEGHMLATEGQVAMQEQEDPQASGVPPQRQGIRRTVVGDLKRSEELEMEHGGCRRGPTGQFYGAPDHRASRLRRWWDGRRVHWAGQRADPLAPVQANQPFNLSPGGEIMYTRRLGRLSTTLVILLILGGVGNDIIHGNEGNDMLWGDGDQDLLWGDSGMDMLSGDDGLDHHFGGDGHDTLLGGAGEDLLIGNAGFDDMNGGDDDDELDACDGETDQVSGNGGIDRYIHEVWDILPDLEIDEPAGPCGP
jgi:hypothetical protein